MSPASAAAAHIVAAPLRRVLLGELAIEKGKDLARQPHDPQSLQKSQLHRVYAPKFDSLSSDSTALTAYIEKLERDGGLYSASRDPSLLGSTGLTAADKLEAPLRQLAEWGSQPAETFILDVLVRYSDGELQLSQVTRALRSIESFLVRRFLAGIVRPAARPSRSHHVHRPTDCQGAVRPA